MPSTSMLVLEHVELEVRIFKCHHSRPQRTEMFGHFFGAGEGVRYVADGTIWRLIRLEYR